MRRQARLHTSPGVVQPSFPLIPVRQQKSAQTPKPGRMRHNGTELKAFPRLVQPPQPVILLPDEDEHGRVLGPTARAPSAAPRPPARNPVPRPRRCPARTTIAPLPENASPGRSRFPSRARKTAAEYMLLRRLPAVDLPRRTLQPGQVCSGECSPRAVLPVSLVKSRSFCLCL